MSAEAVQDEKSVEMDPSVKALPSEEERQIDPEVKPALSALQKLAISTAVGGIAGGAFYLIRSNKVGSVVLGLASLAVTYIVT